jgi:hypothetical protein
MSDNGSHATRPGEFFESIQVRTEDQELVRRGLDRAMRSMGFVPVAPESLPPYEDPLQEEIEVAARRFLVGPAIEGWVALFPSADLPEQLATAQRLSEETHQDVLVLNLHNGDVFYYWLFREGHLVDQYDSNPDYFGEPRTPEELEAVRGHPSKLRTILPSGVEPEDVEAILTQSFAADELKEPDPDRLVLWGDEQFDAFTRLLGVRNAAHSFADAKAEGLDGFVEQPEAFAELAYAPPLRSDAALGGPAPAPPPTL